MDLNFASNLPDRHDFERRPLVSNAKITLATDGNDVQHEVVLTDDTLLLPISCMMTMCDDSTYMQLSDWLAHSYGEACRIAKPPYEISLDSVTRILPHVSEPHKIMGNIRNIYERNGLESHIQTLMDTDFHSRLKSTLTFDFIGTTFTVTDSYLTDLTYIRPTVHDIALGYYTLQAHTVKVSNSDALANIREAIRRHSYNL